MPASLLLARLGPPPSPPKNIGGPSPAPTQNQAAPRSAESPEQRGAGERLPLLLTPRVRPGVCHGNTGTVMSLRLPPQPQHPHHLHQVCGDREPSLVVPCSAVCSQYPPLPVGHPMTPLVTPPGGSLCAIPVLSACLECQSQGTARG